MTTQDEIACLLRDIKTLLSRREDIDTIVSFSATGNPWILDYQNRKYVYLLAPNAFSLTIEEYGTVGVPADTWTIFNYPEGIRVNAVLGTQLALVRFTDTLLAIDESSHQLVFSEVAPLTSVAASVSAGGVQLLGTNRDRKGVYLFNDSTAILYLAYGPSASSSAYTVQIPANGFWEMPVSPIWVRSIFGIWSAAVGNARITELN